MFHNENVTRLTGRSFRTNGDKAVHEVGGCVAIQERYDQAQEKGRQKHFKGRPSRHFHNDEGPVRKERESRRSGFTLIRIQIIR